MKNEYEDVIIKKLLYHDVIRGDQLALKVMEDINPARFDRSQYLNILSDLIESRQVIQLFYTTPTSGTRVLYFINGTKFEIGAK